MNKGMDNVMRKFFGIFLGCPAPLIGRAERRSAGRVREARPIPGLRLSTVVAVALLWFFVLPLPGAATSSLRAVEADPLSIEQLTQKSALVVRGVVLSKSCQRDPAGRIYTRVALQVAEVWKGSLATNQFTIVHGGGILGAEKAAVSGQVEYRIGEEIVAFLVLNQRGEGVTLGLAQGKFHVWQEPETGEQFVYDRFQVNHDSRGHAASGNVLLPGRQRLTLAELKRRVQGGHP